MPSMLVLDSLGLNDPVIAHFGLHVTPRRMAHERRPPPGYVECFQANVTLGLAVEDAATGALLDVMSYPQGYRERLDLSRAGPAAAGPLGGQAGASGAGGGLGAGASGAAHRG
jgi:arabinofuranosyltransferase